MLNYRQLPIMLKFGLKIVLGMIQKSDAAIFEILIFRDFSGGQSPNFGPNRPFGPKFGL